MTNEEAIKLLENSAIMGVTTACRGCKNGD